MKTVNITSYRSGTVIKRCLAWLAFSTKWRTLASGFEPRQYYMVLNLVEVYIVIVDIYNKAIALNGIIETVIFLELYFRHFRFFFLIFFYL